MAAKNVIVSCVGVGEIVALRRAVLMSDRPPDVALFPGDEDAESVHFAAQINAIVIGCCTLHREPYAGQRAWRLRGMAVDESVRGAGIGRFLLKAVDDHAANTGPALLWCNARLLAVPFYQKLGWTVESAQFDIPQVGPHHVMVRRLDGTPLNA